MITFVVIVGVFYFGLIAYAWKNPNSSIWRGFNNNNDLDFS